MKKPGPLVMLAGYPPVTLGIFLVCAVVVLGWFRGQLPGWWALLAMLAGATAGGCAGDRRKYKRWAAQWNAIAEIPTPEKKQAAASEEKRKHGGGQWWKVALALALLVLITLFSPALPGPGFELTPREIAGLIAVRLVQIASVGYLVFTVARFLLRRVRKSGRQGKGKKLAAGAAPVSWLVSRASSSPGREDVVRELPEYCAALLDKSAATEKREVAYMRKPEEEKPIEPVQRFLDDTPSAEKFEEEEEGPDAGIRSYLHNLNIPLWGWCVSVVVLCAVVGSVGGMWLRHGQERKDVAPEKKDFWSRSAPAPETARAAPVPEKQADEGGGGFGQEMKNDTPQGTTPPMSKEKQQEDFLDKYFKEKAIPGIWKDKGTGLMWTAEDTDTKLDWLHASGYCSSLRLGEVTGWRLPSSGELSKVIRNPQFDAEGGIELHIETSFLWTAGTEKDRDGKEYAEAFYRYQGHWEVEDDKPVEEKARALCVHDKI